MTTRRQQRHARRTTSAASLTLVQMTLAYDDGWHAPEVASQTHRTKAKRVRLRQRRKPSRPSPAWWEQLPLPPVFLSIEAGRAAYENVDGKADGAGRER